MGLIEHAGCKHGVQCNVKSFLVTEFLVISVPIQEIHDYAIFHYIATKCGCLIGAFCLPTIPTLGVLHRHGPEHLLEYVPSDRDSHRSSICAIVCPWHVAYSFK